jgi:HEAT repeat protein
MTASWESYSTYIELLKSRNETDRLTAIEQLSSLGVDVVWPLLEDVVITFFSMDKNDHLDDETYEAAYEVFQRVGEPAFDELLDIYKNETDEIWYQEPALEAISHLKNDKVYDVLLEALDSDNLNFCNSVANGLGLLGDKRAIEPLAKMMYARKPSITANTRITIAYSLAKLDACDKLIEHLYSKDYFIRDIVIRVLERYGSIEHVPALKLAKQMYNDGAIIDSTIDTIERWTAMKNSGKV